MRIYECSYIDILDPSKNVSMSGGYIYTNINEFVSDLIQFIDDYIDSSWIPQTGYRQRPRCITNDTKVIQPYGIENIRYNNSSELLEICQYLKRSKYLYLNLDRTAGIVIHTGEYKFEAI
jgi:hypothetical protein